MHTAEGRVPGSTYLFFSYSSSFPSLVFLETFFNVYLFLKEKERQSTSGGGAESEGDTESEAGSRLRAVSPEPHVGLEPTDREIMT